MKTWLLVSAQPDGILKTFLDERRAVAAETFPVAHLIVQHHEIDLRFESEAAAKAVFDHVKSSDPLLTFVGLDHRFLPLLDGRIFDGDGGRFIRFCAALKSGAGAALVHPHEPYAGRFFIIEKCGANSEARTVTIAAGSEAATASHSTQLPASPETPAEASFPVVFAPIAVSGTREELGSLWQAKKPSSSRMNGCFLPPWDASSPAEGKPDAFSAKALLMRAGLRAVVDHGAARNEESAALVLLRLVDHPLLRDVQREGGSLEIRGEIDRPTRLVVGLSRLDDRVARYRSYWLGLSVGQDDPVAKEWRDWPAMLRTDLLAPLDDASLCSWERRPPPPAPSSTLRIGTALYGGAFTRFVRQLAAQIKDDAARRAIEDILQPEPVSEADAISHFLATCLPARTVSDPERAAWADVLISHGFIDHELLGRHRSPKARIHPSKVRLFGYKKNRAEVSDIEAEQRLLTFSLVLPLGSIIRKGGTFKLGTAGALGMAFKLAS